MLHNRMKKFDLENDKNGRKSKREKESKIKTKFLSNNSILHCLFGHTLTSVQFYFNVYYHFFSPLVYYRLFTLFKFLIINTY